jgi:hypothetical protein
MSDFKIVDILSNCTSCNSWLSSTPADCAMMRWSIDDATTQI